MSKEIDGGIVVINTITRATEDTDYPIVMASDVDLDSGISVEDKFKEIDDIIGYSGGGMSEIDDTIVSEDFTWSSQLISNKLIELKDNLLSIDNVYTKDQTYTKEEINSQIDITVSNELKQYSTTTETQEMVNQSMEKSVTESKSYTDEKCKAIEDDVFSLQSIVGDGYEEFDEEYILSLFEDD